MSACGSTRRVMSGRGSTRRVVLWLFMVTSHIACGWGRPASARRAQSLFSSLAPSLQPVGSSLNATWATPDWLAEHPAAELDASPRAVALCMFGVPGVSYAKASKNIASQADDAKSDSRAALSAASCAKNHLEFVVRPAQEANLTVCVFVHAWAEPNGTLARALDSAYGDVLASAEYQLSIGSPAGDKMISMSRSVARSLALARSYAGTMGRPFDLVLIMRHDTFYHRPFCISQIDPRFLTIALWCSAHGIRTSPSKTPPPDQKYCAKLTLAANRGLHDYWFVGGQLLLEFVFGSLEARLLRGEKVGAVPTAAHFAIQTHVDELGLTARGMVRSHAYAVSYAHFTLFRWRNFLLDDKTTPPSGCLIKGAKMPCDGRSVCLAQRGKLATLAPRDIGPFG